MSYCSLIFSIVMNMNKYDDVSYFYLAKREGDARGILKTQNCHSNLITPYSVHAPTIKPLPNARICIRHVLLITTATETSARPSIHRSRCKSYMFYQKTVNFLALFSVPLTLSYIKASRNETTRDRLTAPLTNRLRG